LKERLVRLAREKPRYGYRRLQVLIEREGERVSHKRLYRVYREAGRPMQNGHVESFHGKLREECLRASWFRNLFDARVKIADWRKEYNEVQPHSSLDYRTPDEFASATRRASGGKDADLVCLENASGVSHFPTSPATG
jgi:transposase InsO family protein